MSRLSKTGRAVYATGAMRTYENGDGVGFVWRWWHPVSWIMAPLLFVLQVLVSGAPDAWRNRHEIGLRMNPWFVANPQRLKWTNQP